MIKISSSGRGSYCWGTGYLASRLFGLRYHAGSISKMLLDRHSCARPIYRTSKWPTHFWSAFSPKSSSYRSPPSHSEQNPTVYQFRKVPKKKMIHKSKVNSPRILIDIDRLRRAARDLFLSFCDLFGPSTTFIKIKQKF